jgi:Ser/Thr protein kinase RdoA (MazF antagonist)
MQKSFSALSRRGQTRRMARMARKALEAYPVPVASVTPLKQVYNKNFRITTQNGDQYMLRIYHPRRTSTDVIRSEMLWLAALRQEADLNVPEPVLNYEMDYITIVAAADVPRPYLCALFHWIEGRFLYRTLTPSHLFRVGELMARLHHHAGRWARPAGFTRRRVDNLNPLRQERDDSFDEAVAAQVVQAVAAASTPQAGTLVAAVIQKVWVVLQALGEGPDTFGLIHADLHQSNYLFHNGRAGAIDFDDCGYGHWLYDLAVTLYCLRDHPRFTVLREAFLKGYRRSHSLSTDQEAYLGPFMALRTLQDLMWVIEERDQPAFRDRWRAQMINQLQALREFVNP